PTGGHPSCVSLKSPAPPPKAHGSSCGSSRALPPPPSASDSSAITAARTPSPSCRRRFWSARTTAPPSSATPRSAAATAASRASTPHPPRRASREGFLQALRRPLVGGHSRPGAGLLRIRQGRLAPRRRGRVPAARRRSGVPRDVRPPPRVRRAHRRLHRDGGVLPEGPRVHAVPWRPSPCDRAVTLNSMLGRAQGDEKLVQLLERLAQPLPEADGLVGGLP